MQCRDSVTCCILLYIELHIAQQGFRNLLYSVVELQQLGGENSNWLVQCKQCKHGLISKNQHVPKCNRCLLQPGSVLYLFVSSPHILCLLSYVVSLLFTRSGIGGKYLGMYILRPIIWLANCDLLRTAYHIRRHLFFITSRHFRSGSPFIRCLSQIPQLGRVLPRYCLCVLHSFRALNEEIKSGQNSTQKVSRER